MPSRVFPAHRVRQVIPLDGAWDLFTPAEAGGTRLAAENWRGGRRRVLCVPGVWETLPGLENYRGEAVARRVFATERAGAARLVFRGVAHTARVFLDGREVGGHTGDAFAPFAIEVSRLEAGEHELLVHISNAHGELSALHVENDYYTYGGINRQVEVELLAAGAVFVRFAHFTPRREAGGDWAARVRLTLVNLGAEPARVGAVVAVAGRSVELAVEALPPGESARELELSGFGDVEPWSPAKPALHELVVELRDAEGRVVDDLRDRVGFRTVEVSGERILLNGEPVFLMGFNRHEDHGLFGCALPLEAMHQDIAILKDLNANTVRTSHYPNDERFLDLCDEHGLMVWEENHARGLSLAQMKHPRFREQAAASIAAMVEWHFNHPSIVIWGILNECASEAEEGRAMYAEQFAQLRAADASRPVTFASCKRRADLCQDLVDVASWNLYDNWYVNRGIASELEIDLAWLAEHGAKGKPFIASEFGAGGIPGYHDPRRRAKWSEDRQADILRECLEVYLKHPRVCGALIWQFCDVRVDEALAMGRPRCINDKGVVDEFRRPKLAYEVVRELFAEKLRA